MDEDTLAPIVADRYLRQKMNRAKAKSARNAYGDLEAVEAGVKSTQHLSSQVASNDDKEKSEADHEESENDDKRSQVEDSGSDNGGPPEANDRWYFGEAQNDEGKHVLTFVLPDEKQDMGL